MSLSKHSALREAKRRWGPNAGLMWNSAPRVGERCAVGVYRNDGTFVPMAGGRSWEGAFAAANLNPETRAFTEEVQRILKQEPLAGLPRMRLILAFAAAGLGALAVGGLLSWWLFP